MSLKGPEQSFTPQHAGPPGMLSRDDGGEEEGSVHPTTRPLHPGQWSAGLQPVRAAGPGGCTTVAGKGGPGPPNRCSRQCAGGIDASPHLLDLPPVSSALIISDLRILPSGAAPIGHLTVWNRTRINTGFTDRHGLALTPPPGPLPSPAGRERGGGGGAAAGGGVLLNAPAPGISLRRHPPGRRRPTTGHRPRKADFQSAPSPRRTASTSPQSGSRSASPQARA
jgi:hypothetical protein